MCEKNERKNESEPEAGSPVSVHHVDEFPPRVGKHEILDRSFCVVKDVLVEAWEVDSSSVGRWREIRSILEAVGF